jgi:hypothetical protein
MISAFPCRRRQQAVSRRDFLWELGGGLGGVALSTMLSEAQAASNPLAMPSTPEVQDSILFSQLVSPYVIEDIGDTVNSGTMTFEIEYGRLAGLRPS